MADDWGLMENWDEYEDEPERWYVRLWWRLRYWFKHRVLRQPESFWAKHPPRTHVTSEPVSADAFNGYIAENLAELRKAVKSVHEREDSERT